MKQNNNKQFFRIAPIATAVAAAVLSTQAMAVDFHGYARAGLSTNLSGGGEQTCFGNGADGHFVGRLADECDTYGELALGQELFNKDGKTFRFDSMLAYQAGNQGNDYQSLDGPDDLLGVDFGNSSTRTNSSEPWQGGDIALRQAYVSGVNVVDALPGATLWAGKRFYQRKDIHHLDLFYVNNSGYGGGVENINAGAGKLSVAWLNFDTPERHGGAYVQNNKFDIRYTMPVGAATLELIGIYGMADLTDAQEDADVADENGYFLTAELSHAFMGGFNKVVLQYGADSMGPSAFGNHAGGESLNGAWWDGQLESSWRIIDHGVVKLGSNVEMGYSAIYQMGKTIGSAGTNGVVEDKPDRWSVVVRPVYKWDDISSTALELGFDSVTQPWMDDAQDLQKIAIAQQWSAGPSYWARPVIRAYAAAFFGDQAEDRTAEGVDGDIQVGLQMEAWW